MLVSQFVWISVLKKKESTLNITTFPLSLCLFFSAFQKGVSGGGISFRSFRSNLHPAAFFRPRKTKGMRSSFASFGFFFFEKSMFEWRSWVLLYRRPSTQRVHKHLFSSDGANEQRKAPVFDRMQSQERLLSGTTVRCLQCRWLFVQKCSALPRESGRAASRRPDLGEVGGHRGGAQPSKTCAHTRPRRLRLTPLCLCVSVCVQVL